MTACPPHSPQRPATITTPAPIAILGGMGPAAGVDFARLFLQACERLLRQHGQPVTDQAYPAHWLAQIPVPDRTTALRHPTAPQPLHDMAQALQQLARLGARHAVLACNTAHAWHPALQDQVPQLHLLHIARETASALRRQGHRRAALLATQGTYRMGLYTQALANEGIDCILPLEDERETLMHGIYHGVKAGNLPLATTCFERVATALMQRHNNGTPPHADTAPATAQPLPLIMGCTEIPLALPLSPLARQWTLTDPAAILAHALACHSYGIPTPATTQG